MLGTRSLHQSNRLPDAARTGFGFHSFGRPSVAEEAEFLPFYLKVGIRPVIHGEKGVGRPG